MNDRTDQQKVETAVVQGSPPATIPPVTLKRITGLPGTIMADGSSALFEAVDGFDQPLSTS